MILVTREYKCLGHKTILYFLKNLRVIVVPWYVYCMDKDLFTFALAGAYHIPTILSVQQLLNKVELNNGQCAVTSQVQKTR